MTARRAFTMIELLLAITLMSIIVAAGYASFAVATRVWRTGTAASDSIQHADYILDLLSMALRSAYYPDASRPSPAHGMQLFNDGDDENAHDTLVWVKLGSALVGKNSPVANTPHKISVTALRPGDSDREGFEDGGLEIRAWRMSALPEDFDENDEEYVKPLLVTPEVIALDFKLLDPDGNLLEGEAPDAEDAEEGLKWIDEDWKDDYTNRLPYAISMAVFLRPPEEGGTPIKVQRLVTIPTAPLSWRDKGAAGGSQETGGRKRNDRRGGAKGPNNKGAGRP